MCDRMQMYNIIYIGGSPYVTRSLANYGQSLYWEADSSLGYFRNSALSVEH
jgi:hypothetical protein